MNLTHTATADPTVGQYSCTWCATDVPAVVHVEGCPRPDLFVAAADVLACADCAPEVIERAVEELDHLGQVILTPASPVARQAAA